MPEERFADVGGGIRLCFEQFGPPDGQPLLLVMGLGTQMIGWPDPFCELLGERGFRVTRFDNRDIGRSTKVDGRPPTVREMVRRSREAAAYVLSDMARDAIGLLDHLELDRAHVAGASMGGMIAQTIAIEHPSRTASLASIMSTTGGRFVGQPAPSMLGIFLRRPAPTPELALERTVATFTKIGSPGFDREEAELRALVQRSFDRGGASDQAGSGRQLQAILASPDRTEALGAVTVPTVVIHGTADRLVRPSGGVATAKAIPGARLVRVPGMGHDLPRGAWPVLADALVVNAARNLLPGRELVVDGDDRSAAAA